MADITYLDLGIVSVSPVVFDNNITYIEAIGQMAAKINEQTAVINQLTEDLEALTARVAALEA